MGKRNFIAKDLLSKKYKPVMAKLVLGFFGFSSIFNILFFCNPNLILHRADTIFFVTNVSPLLGLSWLNNIPLQPKIL